MSYRLGFDIGGTFTDLILIDEETGTIHQEKVSTTPPRFSDGALEGVEKVCRSSDVDFDELEHLSHGTTVATNALLERNGAETGLITTDGFRDVIAIGREKRSEIYDLSPPKKPTFADRTHRRTIEERITADGEVLQPIDADEVSRLANELDADDLESVAVSLLHSYRNDEHERRVADIVREETDLHVSVSSDVMKEIQEYERTLSTVINAYVAPIVSRYLTRLTDGLADLGITERLHLMQANGGVVTPDTIDGRQLRLINSGPAAGVLGAKELASHAGIANVITLDMGGTSTDTCLVRDGAIETTTEGEIDDVPLLYPQIDVRAIGTGGGSIAWLDQADVLKVGPRSAGADPGPACYGRGGTEPTVTDAALVLRHLNPDYFLGGEMTLDEDAARTALEGVAASLDVDLLDLADGILEIATTNMLGGIRLVTVEQGYDPRDFVLTCYGGAGPLFADRLARKLGIERALIPAAPGVLSAFGLVTANRRFDFSASRPMVLDPNRLDEVTEIYQKLEERAADIAPNASFERTADLRYHGQTFKLTIDVPNGQLDTSALEVIRDRFEDEYESIYGQTNPEGELEGVTWRLDAVNATDSVMPAPETTDNSVDDAIKTTRSAYTDGEFREHTVYDRYALPTGARVAGPAIVEEAESTTVIGPESSFRVDAVGNLIIDVDGEE